MVKIIYSFFEVSCVEVKVVLRVVATDLVWLNFVFAIFPALAVSKPCLSEWHGDKSMIELIWQPQPYYFV